MTPYYIIAGNEEDFLSFCKEKGILDVAVYLNDEKMISDMKKATIIYKGKNYMKSHVLQIDILRIRAILGEITFREWI